MSAVDNLAPRVICKTLNLLLSNNQEVMTVELSFLIGLLDSQKMEKGIKLSNALKFQLILLRYFHFNLC